MYSAHCFVGMKGLIDNTYGAVAKLGELSRKSKTYSRDMGIYGSDTYPDAVLMCFRSVKTITESSGSTTTNNIVMPTRYQTPLLHAAQWFYTQCTNLVFTSDATACAQVFNSEFSSIFKIEDIGSMVVDAQGRYLPQYITLSLVSDTDGSTVKMWFANSAFENQYSFFEIGITIPTDSVDLMHQSAEVFVPLIASIDTMDVVNKANRAYGGTAYTHLVARDYIWYDSTDSTQHTKVTFLITIWGEAGNNDDAIRDAIKNYILSNTSYSESIWRVHFPDLFIPTEFYIVPLWNNIAIEFQTVLSGVYGSGVQIPGLLTTAQSAMYGYSSTWISQGCSIHASPYKSVMFLAIGSQENRLAETTLTAQYPDYLAVSTTSADFDRMSTNTQGFCILLNSLLYAAESMTSTSDVPQGMLRVVRGGNTYVSATYNDADYLVLTKAFFNS